MQGLGLAFIGLVVVGLMINGALDKDSSSDVAEADPTEQRTCEIFYDISSDAAANIDTIDETRARFRDLLDGYGQTVNPTMGAALEDIVAALTTVDTDALEAAVNRMSAACA